MARSNRTTGASRAQRLAARLLEIAVGMRRESSAGDVHKLRTTLRRLEVALKPALAASGGDQLHRKLAKLRKAAGATRDIDVHLEALATLDSPSIAPARDAMCKLLSRSRRKHEARLVRLVGAALDGGLQEGLTLTAAAATPGEAAHPAAIMRSAAHRYSNLTRTIPESGSELHALRIAAKRLRYELEPFAPEEGSRAMNPTQARARKMVAEFKRVQDAIGTWHDWATLSEEAEERLPQPRAAEFRGALRAVEREKLHLAQRAAAEARWRLESVLVEKRSVRSASVAYARRRAAV